MTPRSYVLVVATSQEDVRYVVRAYSDEEALRRAPPSALRSGRLKDVEPWEPKTREDHAFDKVKSLDPITAVVGSVVIAGSGDGS